MPTPEHDEYEDAPRFAPVERLFGARHLAVVGASADPDKIGGRPLRYLDRAGFDGVVHPVNPRYDEVMGRPCAPSVAAIDGEVDLAIVAVPARAVEAAIDDCAAAGVPYAIVFSSGFAEVGAEGRARQDALVERARAGGVRLLGPNSLGIASSPNGLMASFATLFDRHETLLEGRVGFLSQSGALGVFIYALAQDQGLGFSRFVSIGNEADLDVADFLAFLANDPATSAIGGYLEGIDDGGRFLAAAERARAAGKPMSFLKVGRSDAGRRAAESHTGSLAGSDEVYDAALRQAGIVRASDPQGLIDFLDVHGRARRRPLRPGVAVLTISGGAGVWCADRLADHGLDLADLAPDTLATLTELLPAFATPQNPVDATGQIINDPLLFAGCIDALLEDPGVSTLVVVLGLQERGGDRFAQQIVDAHDRHAGTAIVVTWLAGPSSAMELLRRASVPAFGDLARAVEVVAGGVAASGHLDRSAPAAPATAAHRVVDLDGRALDTEHDAKALLAEAGIVVPAGTLCATVAEVIEAAARIGGAVALKGQVAGLAHKTEHRLVHLGLRGASEVRAAASELEGALAAAAPASRRQGILVEPMAPDGVDLIVGCIDDTVFGPTLMVGAGGVLVEVVRDTAFRVAPVDVAAALEMLGETRAGPLLDGARGGPPLDRRAVAEVVARLSALVVGSGGRIREVEINPLRAHVDGAVALDALVATGEAR